MANILYISLTGMTEPLGRSQVLEYLMGLSSVNTIYLISFERNHSKEEIETIQGLTQKYNITWRYYKYSNKFGLFSTILQILKAIRLASGFIKQSDIEIVHARSMIPATMGLILKKCYKIKLLFDIRGFSIDEKAENGRLKKGAFLFKVLKNLDNHLYRASDHIITLTYSAKKILHETLGIPLSRITVIPTCANREVFKRMNKDDKHAFKLSLGYSLRDRIILHTGTVSGWYDFESEVKLVKEMIKQDINVYYIILNRNEAPFIHNTLEQLQFPKGKVKVMSSSFEEVHYYLNIAWVSLFFIKPSFSKQASSPTKFAENVACQLPSVTNIDIGDMAYYIQRYNVGYVVALSALQEDVKEIAKELLEKISPNTFSQSDFCTLFNEHFDNKVAIEKYQLIYENLI